jgi:MAF protein
MSQKIILASTSPYRKMLMKKLDLPFECLSPLCNEESLKNTFKGSAKELCSFLAQEKALSLDSKLSDCIIIGSDQALIFDNRAVGKSGGFDQSYEQLKNLSGQTVDLITACFLRVQNGKDRSFECNAKMTFKKLSDEEIKNYLKMDEPYDCAGSFKYEENGHKLFEKVEVSDTTAIQGLPLNQLRSLLKEI